MQSKKYGLLKIGVLSAFMMLMIMLPSMLQNHGIYVIRGDYVDQYIPRLIRSREILTSGGATWDWFNFLGSSFNKINILFSTNVICLLFPSNLIPYAVTYMHLARVALIAMAVYAYLRYMVKEEKNAFLGALLYTFSSYTFINLEFMQFLEVLWAFPLLLLAAEKMFREETYRYQLILAVFLSCAFSFYFFVFSSLLFGIYFLCRFFFAEEWKPKRSAKYFFLAVLEYFIGFLCAFLIFAPFLYGLFHSSGSAEKIGKTDRYLIEYFVDLRFVARVFSFFVPAASNRFSSFGGSNWNSLGAYLPVFGISFVLAGLTKKDTPKWVKFLSIAGVLCILLPIICLIFNMLSSAYTRHGYGTVLFFVLTTVLFLESYDEKLAKKSVWVTAGCFFLLVGIYLLFDFLIGDHPILFYILHGREGEEKVEQILRIYVMISSALFYLVLIGFVYSGTIRRFAIPILVAVIVIYGGSYTYMNLRSDFLLDYNQNSTIDLKTQVERYLGDIPEKEIGADYRIDASNQLRNYAYVIKQPSISIFESVRGTYSDEVSARLNYYDGGVSVFPQEHDNATRTLLGVKYYYDLYPEDKVPVPENFTYLKTDNKVGIYRNDEFVGMGFSYDRYITRTEFDKIAENKKNCSELMLNTLVVEDEDVPVVEGILKPYQKGYRCENRIPFDEFSMTSDGFTARVKLTESKVMYVAAPFEDEGWSATCNGEELKFIKANIGLIAFPLEAGENEIVFQYQSPAEPLGRYVSCIGWIALLIYVIIREKKRVNKEEM